jgi:hypothetical protein
VEEHRSRLTDGHSGTVVLLGGAPVISGHGWARRGRLGLEGLCH